MKMWLVECYKNMTAWGLLLALAGSAVTMPVLANTESVAVYRVQPGDVLNIAVWREEDLHMEVLIRPDGGFSVPLIGEVSAEGKSIPQLHDELQSRYGKYIPDTDVTVSIKQLNGNKIYVIGKVARPGEFVILRPIDVMQALSKAGGVTPFADVNDIKILRRIGSKQQVFGFQYSSVESGEELEQNIMLKSGDVVVVP